MHIWLLYFVVNITAVRDYLISLRFYMDSV